MKHDSELKLIFSEVLSCRSYIKPLNIYIKHLTNFDSYDIDFQKEIYTERAKKNKLATNEEKEKILFEDESWSKEKNDEIVSLENFLETLYKTKKLQILRKQIDSLNKEIKDTQIKLNNLKQEKFELLGLTVESFTIRKINEFYIRTSLFKDKKCEIPAYNLEDFDELTQEELGDLINKYNEIVFKFSSYNLKRVSLASFFSNFFYLSDNNPYVFYGKPVINLTFYQAELYGYGLYFKRLIADSKVSPPESVLEDPDKLIEWFDASQNAEKIINQTEGAVSIPGATKEDYKNLGIADENNTIDLFKEASKKGGSLDMNDLIKLQMQ